MSEDTNLDAPDAETPSDAGVPDEDMPETPSGDDEPEAADEAEDEVDSEDSEDAEPSEDGESSDDEDDESWKNFEKKFAHIKNPRDRRAAMGRAWWEKNNFASRTNKEKEELSVRLARLEAIQAARDEKKDEQPPEPPPELAKIDQRIQALYQKDQAVQAQQNRSLVDLSEADKQVAILEDRLKDADDYAKAILEQKMETAKIRRESILNRWADLNEKREAISLEMEQRLGERDWTAKSIQDKANRDQSERQSLEQFNAEFPKHVDSLIVSSADSLGAPKDPKVRQSLWRSVNRAMMVDLWQLGDKGLQQVDIPAMVSAHVKEYLEDRDLVGRKTFSARSAEKLKVAGREAGKPARPVSAAQRPPVPPSLLTQGDTTPAMRRARELLTRRFGG